MAERERLDRLLVERGLVETRSRAQALVLAGKVIVDGQRVDKAGALVSRNADVRLRGQDHPYVSRGGLKLAGALDEFARGTAEHAGLQVTGRVALDIGASTG